MKNIHFFRPACRLRLSDVVEISGAKLVRGAPDSVIENCAPVDHAQSGDLTFLDSARYLEFLKTSSATACICRPHFEPAVPENMALLVSEEPTGAYGRVVSHMFPDALRPRGNYAPDALDNPIAGTVHPTAVLEEGVRVEPGAIVGAGAVIGQGTIIGSSTVIGAGVAIGRNSAIGANSTVICALIGDRVIIHAGVSIGQDGFGFHSNADGHVKIPQIGRVVIQDDVEIGANCAIDRGANRDTIIGEGSKLDNMVQIGHNVVVGRHCLLVAQVGISGSAILGDFVAIGGQTGVNGHVKIGDRAQIAAVSTVHGDVPPGERWGGTPARPIKEWMREFTMLRRMVRTGALGSKLGEGGRASERGDEK